MTFTATKAGGGAGSDFANWELFNSNQGTIGETGAIYEQSWTGTSSNGVLKGTNTPAPDGDNPFGSTDCNLALVTLSNIELYSTISIVVSTTNGGNDYIGFLGGKSMAVDPCYVIVMTENAPYHAMFTRKHYHQLPAWFHPGRRWRLLPVPGGE